MRGSIILTFVVVWFAALSGCSTSQTKLSRGYIGLQMNIVVDEYGYPSAAHFIDENRRAFIWRKKMIKSKEELASSDKTFQQTLMFSENYSTTAVEIESPCNYVFIGKRTVNSIGGPAAWVVIDVKEPDRECD